jgi:hypothetical protein
MDKYQRPPYNGNFREAGREEGQKMDGEDQLSRKSEEAGITKMNGSC